MADGSKKPVKVYRLGNVSASVFVRTLPAKDGRPERQIGSVCLQKSFKDDSGNRKYTNYFDAHELANAARVLEMAAEYVITSEAEVTVGTEYGG